MSYSGKHKIYLDKKAIEDRHLYRLLKRIFDFITSLVGIILLLPLFLVVAGLIKVEDHGKIIYKQTRVGRNGSLFSIYKFRSMRMDADKHIAELLKYNQVEGPMFKIKDDPRITKIGKFIRKTSIDELPQLVNVLRGQMSLVGPRPPLVTEVKQYSEYDKQRLLVIPGCTGLWQVSGRNDVGFSEMVELDLEYIEKSNLLFDFFLVIKTLKIMIIPNGAY